MSIQQGYAATKRHPLRVAGLILIAVMLSMTAFFLSRQDTNANLGQATFEIYDGDTHTGNGVLGPAKDWANVYAGTSGADFAKFIPDVNFPAGTQPNGDDQPATGATKDPYDMDAWDCKAAGLAPPKNDIANAFVADYTVTVATDALHPDGKAQVIYFGLDRVNSDNGTADVGFWILKDSHACDLTTGKWNTQKHSLNDALVVSEFTGGGRVSTINVFKWCSNPASPDLKCGNSGSNTVPLPGKGDGPLQRVAGGADCRDATTGVPEANGSTTLGEATGTAYADGTDTTRIRASRSRRSAALT